MHSESERNKYIEPELIDEIERITKQYPNQKFMAMN